MPHARSNAGIIGDARRVDIARATENHVTVIRADVAGRTDHLLSYGSSGIVSPQGCVLATARQLTPDLVVAEIDTAPECYEN